MLRRFWWAASFTFSGYQPIGGILLFAGIGLSALWVLNSNEVIGDAVSLFHPGKVFAVHNPTDKEVISAEQNVQASVETWGENVFTFDVDPKIAKEIKEGDVVLVDWSPMPSKAPIPPIPKQIITKILRGKNGEKVWDKYKQFHNLRKALPISTQTKFQGLPAIT